MQAGFLGSEAGSINDVYLESPSNALGIIFTNRTASVGETVVLGTFAAGTELVFGMLHHDSGNHFFSGAPSRNPDGIAHALVDDQYAPNLTRVAFEDLFGGGDRDFNDIEFSLTNVKAVAGSPLEIPEPGTLSLLGAAVILLAAMRRRATSPASPGFRRVVKIARLSFLAARGRFQPFARADFGSPAPFSATISVSAPALPSMRLVPSSVCVAPELLEVLGYASITPMYLRALTISSPSSSSFRS